jgi:hypothetical protein
MKKRSFPVIAVLLFALLISACTDRNNNGKPEYREKPDKDAYGNTVNNSDNQGTENYPGNSKGINPEDKRYGANPEINQNDTVSMKDTSAQNSTHNQSRK